MTRFLIKFGQVMESDYFTSNFNEIDRRASRMKH